MSILLSHNLEHLRVSGLTDATIEAAGIYSVEDAAEAARLLNWDGDAGPVPAIAFPYFDRSGSAVLTILRPDNPFIRSDGTAPKYESPLGLAPRLYFLAPTLVSPDQWTDSSRPLFLVEGIKKALAAVQVGTSAVISAQGVTVWHDIEHKKKTGQYRLHPDFGGIPLGGRVVFIGFDGGDTSSNAPVIAAEARLARMLLDAGARVRLLRIPSQVGGPKVGVDDFLVTQKDPRAAFQRLQDEAIEADPLLRARAAKASNDRAIAIRDLLRDLSFAASLYVADAALLDIVAADLKVAVTKRAVLDAVEGFRRLFAPPPAPAASDGNEKHNRQGTALVFAEPLPWHESVDGLELLENLLATLKCYVVFATEAAAVTVTLWIAFTYVVAEAGIAPMLAVLSPQKRCGKTTLLRLLSELVVRPLSTSNITPAALFRIIEMASPTLLVDEADTFLRDNQDMRGLLNAGHTRETAFVIRTVGDDFEPRRFNVFCAKAIAAIGKLHGTLEDRSLVIRMRRRAKGEAVERVPRTLQSDLEPTRRKIFRWAQDHRNDLTAADSAMPEKLSDRAADNWRPLIAIAELAGGRWPELARRAAVELSATSDDESESAGIQLLSDLRDLFRERKAERIATKEILKYLTGLEERRWKEWKGKGLQAQGLRSLLRPFEIKSSRWKTQNGQDVRGYLVADFNDAFGRYLAAEAGANPPHPPAPRNASEFRQNGSAPRSRASAGSEGQNSQCNQESGRMGGSKGESAQSTSTKKARIGRERPPRSAE